MKLTEEELFNGLGGIPQPEVKPEPRTSGVHGCIKCKLALIPDSSPRQLCYFCSKKPERR